MDVKETHKAVKYTRDAREEIEQPVIIEMPVTVNVNGEELVTLLTTPERLDYMAIGFLWSEGVINTKDEITKLVVDEAKGIVWIDITKDPQFIKDLMFKRLITSGCGKGTTFYNVVDSVSAKPVTGDVTITPSEIIELMGVFQSASKLHKETHGVHAAALCGPSGIIMFREDIGRHNAVDKILGQCLMDDITLDDKVVLTSGRTSSEVLLKTAKKGIPVLVSRTSPTDLAVRLADKLNVTLVGFVRGGSMTVYTHDERVKK